MTIDEELKSMRDDIEAIRTPTTRCPVCERLVRTHGAFLASHPFPVTRHDGQTSKPCSGSGMTTDL